MTHRPTRHSAADLAGDYGCHVARIESTRAKLGPNYRPTMTATAQAAAEMAGALDVPVARLLRTIGTASGSITEGVSR